MPRYLIPALATLVLLSVSPAPTSFAAGAAGVVVASTGAVYDTVDSVQASLNHVTIIGIVAGQSESSELLYTISDFPNSSTAASRCDRLALLAMSKPGKFQFSTVKFDGTNIYACKLVVRTP